MSHPKLNKFLQTLIGESTDLGKITLSDAVDQVPNSRLGEHHLLDTSPETRLRHARGQSLPDWLAMRSGDIGAFPDAVAKPRTVSEVRELLDLASKQNFDVIPYGGGTSVVGHINPVSDENAVLTIDMGMMNQILHVDSESQLVTIGAGATGPQIEQSLKELGFVLGHYPQSWEYSTLGGWVATRSSGQQSLQYGRIEQLFGGANVETLAGNLKIPALPASAAGLDMREIILGSEGRMGIITDVTVRVSSSPETEYFGALYLSSWEEGLAFVRNLIQQRIPLSMLRLSNPLETAAHIAMNGEHRPSASVRLGAVMVTYGISGAKVQCSAILDRLLGLGRNFKAEEADGAITDWTKSRFKAPYLRDLLGDLGYAADTMETAVNWSNVEETTKRIEKAICNALANEDEKVLAYSHLSHMYPQGSSIYTTYLFRMGNSYNDALLRWAKIKKAGAREIVACGGTISHQHGVGTDHKDFLTDEKGVLGIAAMDRLCNLFDPNGQMNPKKLLPDDVKKNGKP